MKNLTALAIMLAGSLTAYAQTNTFPASGNVGIGTTTPEARLDIRGGISVMGANPINGINNFRNSIQIKAPNHGAILFNPGEETELMFGFHTNGNFYWASHNAYVMKLTKVGDAFISNSLAIGGNLKSGSKLSVKGKVAAQEVEVTVSNWPDYVFEEDYELPSLIETEAFIKQHKHLPGMPNKDQVAAEGVNLGEMNRKLLEKVEELMLHLIGEQKARMALASEVRALKTQIKQINNRNQK